MAAPLLEVEPLTVVDNAVPSGFMMVTATLWLSGVVTMFAKRIVAGWPAVPANVMRAFWPKRRLSA